MKKIITLLLGIVLSGQTALQADTIETVTIGDTVVGKFVNRLTFSGDEVMLSFDDGTWQSAEMSLLSVSLTYDGGGQNAITTVTTGGGDEQMRVYSVSGQYLGATTDGLAAGLYIVNGKKVMVK